jgi:hypothetical protein
MMQEFNRIELLNAASNPHNDEQLKALRILVGRYPICSDKQLRKVFIECAQPNDGMCKTEIQVFAIEALSHNGCHDEETITAFRTALNSDYAVIFQAALIALEKYMHSSSNSEIIAHLRNEIIEVLVKCLNEHYNHPRRAIAAIVACERYSNERIIGSLFSIIVSGEHAVEAVKAEAQQMHSKIVY